MYLLFVLYQNHDPVIFHTYLLQKQGDAVLMNWYLSYIVILSPKFSNNY